MSFSYNDFGPKGPGDTITVDFEYERREDVKVLVDGDPVDDSLWEWVNDGLILAKAGFPLGTAGRVQRTTNISSLTGRLVGTAVLDYPTVNGNFDRLLYRLQENDDLSGGSAARMDALELALEDQQGNIDASVELGRRWAEEAENVEVAAGGYSSRHHAAKSSGSAAASEASRIASVNASGVAVAARDAAILWATEDEDVAVDDGVNPPGNSAYHWYRKALAAAGSVLSGLAGLIHGATNKTTPTGADELPIADSAASWGLKKLTLTNLRAWLAQSSALDTTAGKLMAVGAFGLGAQAVSAEVDVLNYPAGAKLLSPSSGLVNLPSGWPQTRYHVETHGGSAYQIVRLTSTLNSALQAVNIWNGTSWLGWTFPLYKEGGTMTGPLALMAGTTEAAPIRIPHGVAPTAPADGEVWSTSTALMHRSNGTTAQIWDDKTLTLISQADAEAGTSTNWRLWSAQRVKQAITALAPASPVGLYTGSDTNYTNYPIGHHVIIDSATVPANRNSSATLTFKVGGVNAFGIAPDGTTISGTWRHRGMHLYQRVA